MGTCEEDPFLSLYVGPNLRKKRPLSGLAIETIEYSQEVTNWLTPWNKC